MAERKVLHEHINHLKGHVEFNGKWYPGEFVINSSSHTMGPDQFSFKFDEDNKFCIIGRHFVRPAALQGEMLTYFWLDGCFTPELLRTTNLLSLGVHGWDFSYDLPIDDKQLELLRSALRNLHVFDYDGPRGPDFQCRIRALHSRVIISFRFDQASVCRFYGCDPTLLNTVFKVAEKVNVYERYNVLDCIAYPTVGTDPKPATLCWQSNSLWSKSLPQDQRDGVIVHSLRTLGMLHMRRALAFFKRTSFLQAHYDAVSGFESRLTDTIQGSIVLNRASHQYLNPADEVAACVFRILVRHGPCMIMPYVYAVDRVTYIEAKKRIKCFDKQQQVQISRLQLLKSKIELCTTKSPPEIIQFLRPRYTCKTKPMRNLEIILNHPHMLDRVTTLHSRITSLSEKIADDVCRELFRVNKEVSSHKQELQEAANATTYLKTATYVGFLDTLQGDLKLLYELHIRMHRSPVEIASIDKKIATCKDAQHELLKQLDKVTKTLGGCYQRHSDSV